MHERLELVVRDATGCFDLHLLKHSKQLFVSQVFTLAAEALLKVLLCDESRVVNVKVMESEVQISLSDCLSPVDCDCQELCVVNLSIVIEVNALKDFANFIFAHVELVESCSDFAQLQSARVVRVESSKRIPQLGKVESTRVHLVNKESQSLDLQTLWLSEVLNATQHEQFVFMEKSRVVSSMVLLNIIRSEPRVFEALLG